MEKGVLTRQHENTNGEELLSLLIGFGSGTTKLACDLLYDKDVLAKSLLAAARGNGDLGVHVRVQSGMLFLVLQGAKLLALGVLFSNSLVIGKFVTDVGVGIVLRYTLEL